MADDTAPAPTPDAAPPVAPPPAPPAKTDGNLPLIYNAAAQARTAGYSWDEINDKFGQARSAAKDAGYSDAEVDHAFGISPSAANDPPPPPGMEQVHVRPDTADNIRAFSQKYLTPFSTREGGPEATPEIHSVGAFAKQLGWDTVDLGKIVGQPVVNGIAAIVEGLDGKPRSQSDQIRLGVEAQGFLGLLASPDMAGGGKGLAGAKAALPSSPEMIDAAAAVAQHHPEGLTPETLTSAAKELGKNFVDTGEHPVAAAQRAVNDPQVMGQLHEQMNLPLPERPGTNPIPPAVPEEMHIHPEPLDQKAFDAAGAAAVQKPGWIPPVEMDRPPALEPSSPEPMSDLASTFSSFGVGALKIPEGPEMAINRETLGQPDPQLGAGLREDWNRVFRIQSLSPEGAGVIRANLADNQANLLRSTENLRRYGRAVGDLSSEARREYWHAYENGDLGPYKGTPLGDLGVAIRGELDRAYGKMQKLDIAPGYIENYLPRLYQDVDGATRVFQGRNPMEGSKVFTRERVFEYLQDAEAAGMKLVTDNPIEATLIRLNDMHKYITAHEIMGELQERGLGTWTVPGAKGPEGMSIINDKIATSRSGSRFYTLDPIATMLNRHLSPGWSGRPIYDVVRSSTSTVTSLKLIGSLFHPLYLASDAIGDAFGMGLKQAARGGVPNIAGGAARLIKSPLAPFENLWQGRKIVNYAKDGLNADPRIATMYDAMIQSGARFGQSEIYKSSAAGSFWNNMAESAARGLGEGRPTMGQELGAMFRNAPDIHIGNQKIAPGYIRAMAQIVPRVMDTISEPIMGKFVPWMKAGALARNLQEMMAAHPDLTIEDIRQFGGRASDQIDNRIGELVQDNIFWPNVLHNINNVVFMAPQWFLGKLRLMGGAVEDAVRGGSFVEGPNGSKELSGNVTTLVGYVAATIFTGALYGYLKGTWKPDWTLRDYVAPPTGGTDNKLGQERVTLPNFVRDAYGWSHDPAHELTNKMAPIWSTLAGLATNTQFNGAAITDPANSWREAGGDYAAFLAKQLSPMMSAPASQSKDANISGIEQWLGLREAPFGIREPELEARYGAKDAHMKVRKKNRADAAAQN